MHARAASRMLRRRPREFGGTLEAATRGREVRSAWQAGHGSQQLLALAVFGGLCERARLHASTSPPSRQTGAEAGRLRLGGQQHSGAHRRPASLRRRRHPGCRCPRLPRRERQPRADLVPLHHETLHRHGLGAASFDLGNLTHPCAVVMPSGLNMNASAFDDHEWLSSPFTTDGSNVYALVHEEYQGWRTGYGHSCTGDFSQQQKCWRNSRDARHVHQRRRAASRRPATWSRPPRTRSRPASAPTATSSRAASSATPTAMYYAMVRSIGTSSTPAQAEGVCVMRTGNLADAASWRAWDGDGFDVSFVKPYPTAPDPASHVCQAVDPDLFRMTSTLVYSEYLGKYLVIDLLNGQGSYNPPGARVPGIYYSTSEDLVSWTSAEAADGGRDRRDAHLRRRRPRARPLADRPQPHRAQLRPDRLPAVPVLHALEHVLQRGRQLFPGPGPRPRADPDRVRQARRADRGQYLACLALPTTTPRSSGARPRRDDGEAVHQLRLHG